MNKRVILLCAALLAGAATRLLAAAFPFEMVNNSCFSDDEIYVGIIGQYNGNQIYYDLGNNSASYISLPTLNSSCNTLHKVSGDEGYANIFTKLSQINNYVDGHRTIYLNSTSACRVFFGFKSPMYLKAYDSGYAGANLQNTSDPNIDVRWEIIEFTLNDYGTNLTMFINTTRVDAFQYPMGLELYGDQSAGANMPYRKRGETKNYADIIKAFIDEYGDTYYSTCYQTYVTKDNLGGIIMQPSKIAYVKNQNVFGSYIDQVWNYFSSHTLTAYMGDFGTWSGSVSGDVFTMTNTSDGRVAKIYGKPSTSDVIEGAGTFAYAPNSSTASQDLALQAQFCGAMNRGMIFCQEGQQNWGEESRFFTSNTWNEYVKFFHRSDLCYESRTYAFAYDDTFDMSSTCATGYATKAVVTIGGYASNAGGAYTGGKGSYEQKDYAVAYQNLSTTLESKTSYTFDIKYTALATSEVWICFYDNTGTWNPLSGGENYVTVNEGSGTAQVTINLASAPAAGSNYILKCDIRPVGGAWTSAYTSQLVQDITVTASGSGSDESSDTSTYDYWVVYRDGISDLSNVKDIRGSVFTVWGNVTEASLSGGAYEGSSALAYTVSASNTWFGFGALNTVGTYDFNDIDGWKLHFAYKTTYPDDLDIKLRLGNDGDEISLTFDVNGDGAWHEVTIPVADYLAAGGQLSSGYNNLIFGLKTESATRSGDYVYIDDIYFYNPSATLVEEGNASGSVNVSVYPNPAESVLFVQGAVGQDLQVIDWAGRVVLNQRIDCSGVAIDTLVSGVYVVRVGNTATKLIKR